MPPLELTADGRLPHSASLHQPPLRRLLDVLNPPGDETRLVGGAVRDALLGRPLSDIDLATTLRPEDVVARTKAARLRSIPTGIAHGTVTVMVEGRRFEVTTLRQDVETDGRHATVRFGRDFDADARRRDFTMNALSAGRDGQVFDAVGGLGDLAAGRVRFIGDADTRIREDYLRILRFFRFHATYGAGPLDPAGLAAAARNQDGLARLSRERIRAEFFKILAASGVLEVLRAMDHAGMLRLILGREANLDRLAGLAAIDIEPDPVLRLAALALHEPADFDDLRDKLRLSNAELVRLQGAARAVASLPAPDSPPDSAELLRLLFDQGSSAIADALTLRAAEAAHPAPWQSAVVWLAKAPVPRLPFSGADMMARGLRGPAVGAALTFFREAWAKAGFPRDPEARAALLDEAVQAAEGVGDRIPTERDRPGS